MEHNRFFPPHDGVSLLELANHLGAEVADQAFAGRIIRSVAPVYRAVEGDVCYILSRKNMDELKTCNASAIICDAALQSIVPSHIPVILSRKPHAAFAIAGAFLHPQAMRPVTVGTAKTGISPAAFVDPSARLEADVLVEPMAVIGAGAEIGEGTQIGAGAIIGAGVKIGRHCSISAGASVLCAYVGNNVIIHNGARIGQDGFGYAPGPAGMLKIVQIGRVIIQDNVEIGANTTIDRGTMDDTVIGEGTKIDNQAQIGHNVRVGRHTAIVSQVGIAGSAKIGDGVQIGGQAGVAGHIHVGDGAQLAAGSGVIFDLAPGGRYGGVPARPIKDFLRRWLKPWPRLKAARKYGVARMTDHVRTELGSADIIEIMKLLPHRYPFLLVDKIIEIDGDNSAIGIKNVTANEPHFTGHFPDQPIMPGVLLIEGMAQTAGAICARKEGQSGSLVYFMTIDNARFRKPVVPGDRVEFHVVKQRQRGNIWKFHCDAKVDGAKVAEADIGAMIVRKEEL